VAKTPKLPKPAAKVAEVTAKAAAAAGGKAPVTEVK